MTPGRWGEYVVFLLPFLCAHSMPMLPCWPSKIDRPLGVHGVLWALPVLSLATDYR